MMSNTDLTKTGGEPRRLLRKSSLTHTFYIFINISNMLTSLTDISVVPDPNSLYLRNTIKH